MYVLHTMPDTAGLAVHILLLELGQPFLMNVIDREGETRDRPDYRVLQPLGKVPALETPDGPLFETAAILLWLADRHGGMAPPPGHRDRGQFLKWLFFTSTNIHTTMMMLTYPETHTGDPAAVPAFLRTKAAFLKEALSLVDAAVARHPGWCPPDAPSVLGIYLSMLVRWAAFFEPGHPGRLDLADYPALRAIAGALESRTAALNAARVEGLGPTIFTNPALVPETSP